MTNISMRQGKTIRKNLTLFGCGVARVGRREGYVGSVREIHPKDSASQVNRIKKRGWVLWRVFIFFLL